MITIAMSFDLVPLAQELTNLSIEEAVDLIEEWDQREEDWDFTLAMAEYFVSQIEAERDHAVGAMEATEHPTLTKLFK